MEYASVDEARAVFDKPENIVLDGRVLFIDYASRPIDEKPGEHHFKLFLYSLHKFHYSPKQLTLLPEGPVQLPQYYL